MSSKLNIRSIATVFDRIVSSSIVSSKTRTISSISSVLSRSSLDGTHTTSNIKSLSMGWLCLQNSCPLHSLNSPPSARSFSAVRRPSKISKKIRHPSSQEIFSDIVAKKQSSPKCIVTAFATAEQYDLSSLTMSIQKQGLYDIISVAEDVKNAVHVETKYPTSEEPRRAFFFKEGALVCWNIGNDEPTPFLPLSWVRICLQEHRLGDDWAAGILRLVREHEKGPYEYELVSLESESFLYRYYEGPSKVIGSEFLVSFTSSVLDKYAFSNALALSVKLAVWEKKLQRLQGAIVLLTEDLTAGRRISLDKEQVLQKMGELLALRHMINIGSDLLDSPDFYWERAKQENLFLSALKGLSVPKRTRVMNEKLNHCLELMELIKTHLSDQHHIRLEWMIISLITIEILFEFLHYLI